MTRRLEVIEEKFGQALSELARKMGPISSKEIVEHFASYDPSRNKSATQWLITTYLNKGFLLEDLSKAYETLLVFSQVKRLLPVDQRSLNKYKTLASMWKTIEEAGLLNSSKYWVEKTGSSRDNLTSKEEKRLEKERAYRESHLVYQGGNLEVVVPLTMFAAQWHGRGTRWPNEDNYFNYSHQYAPFIIMTEQLRAGNVEKTEEGKSETFPTFPRRSQLWVTAHNIRFVDASDARIKTLEEGDVRIPILKWACGINGKALRHIPVSLRDRHVCLADVQSNGEALRYVPRHLIDHEMCMEAIQGGKYTFKGVPDELNLWEVYVQSNKSVFELIPKELRNHDLYMASVQYDGLMLEYVPKEFRGGRGDSSYALCLAAVEQNGQALKWVPKGLQDGNPDGFREICLKAIGQNGAALRYVPESLRNEEICLKATQNCALALQDVPDSLKSYDMCLVAVKNDGRALEYVPEKLKDEMSQYASKEDALLLWEEEILFSLKDIIRKSMSSIPALPIT